MKKVVKTLQKICRVLELVVAFFVLAGIVLSMISLFKSDTEIFEEMLNDMSVFRHYLEKIFNLVIGIEFLEMLCHPTSDSVIQVLIFLVARHMIIGETTPYEDFISVCSVTVLFVLNKYMHSNTKKNKQKQIPDANADGKHSQMPAQAAPAQTQVGLDASVEESH